MAEVPKLLYIVVVDDRGKRDRNDTFRYTRSMLQSTLQLMGCKARHAFKISKGVFEAMKSQCLGDVLSHAPMGDLGLNALEEDSQKENSRSTCGCLAKGEACNHLASVKGERTDSEPFDVYKRRTTVVVKRERFLDVVCDVLAEYKYVGPNQRADVALACRIREKKESVTVLLCGTSGCGKSTLSSLLGSRLGITTVISTDSIRHMMRSFVDEKQNPLLWASTYHAGEFLDRVAVAQAKAKRRAKKLAHVSRKQPKDEASAESVNKKPDSRPADSGSSTSELISPKQMAIEGFKAQSEMVIESLDRLITGWEERKESVVVEGVHLSLNFVMGLMKKHPSIIPFMIYIANEEKHMERFAVRAKYMTLDPEKNKYVKYIRNIRKIQDYLCNRADKHRVPKINNTNVDRSVATIHATVFSCLRRREAGEQLYDPTTNMVSVIDEEYRKQNAANSLSSKGMYQLIQRKGSSRHLMALLNTDGSVAKAWPVNSIGDNGKPIFYQGNEKGIGGPMYGPLQIGKAEPVNLQFGNLGISAWPSDTCGTSHAGSLDESRADGTETGSKYYSSCCSSPRMSDGPAKELKEEQSVSGSDDEEADEPSEVGSDEDLSDVDERQMHEEIEGSVDEESTKSDEEYDDLAMLDGQEIDYWHESEEFKAKIVPVSSDLDTDSVENLKGDKYKKNLDLFLRRNNERASEPLHLYSVPLTEKNQKKMQAVDNIRRRIKRRSLSIPAFKKQESLIQGPIYSGTPQT